MLPTQKLCLAIVLSLVLPTGTVIPGASAVVVRGTTPFLIGPPDGVIDPSADSADENDDTPARTSTHAKASSITSTVITASTSASGSSGTSSTASTSSSSPSISSTPVPPQTPPDRQPSSIRFLIPVFLFILITLGGWGFARWYAKRKRRDAYAEDTTDRSHGWKAVKSDDEDEKDPWYSGISDNEAEEVDWQDVALVPAKSSGAISAAGRGWGWRPTVSGWKSARGRGSETLEDIDELGQRRTIALVPTLGQSATYQTLPDLEGRPIDPACREERGSIQALRDKLASLSYKEIVNDNKLGRNRSPNKRRSQKQVQPPEPPAWIQPRATSPLQMLSPPLQPHLFFHPTPSAQSIHGAFGTVPDESASEYGTDDESLSSRNHTRFPTIPSTAEGLNSYTAIPPRTPRKQRSKVDDDITPKAKSALKRTATTPAESTMRRSTATTHLASTPKLTRAATSKDKSTSSAKSTLSPKKATKSERKAAKAHDKVEEILTASWSDRALASPTSAMSIDGLVAAGKEREGEEMSPGVEQAAVLGGMGGGIEQRLAMLRRMGE